jgi:hypothetical protein
MCAAYFYEPRPIFIPSAQKNLSNVLDTSVRKEHYELWFRCLRRDSRYSVHSQFLLRTSSASSANRAEPIRFFLFSRAGPDLLFDVQVYTPQTPAVSAQIA